MHGFSDSSKVDIGLKAPGRVSLPVHDSIYPFESLKRFSRSLNSQPVGKTIEMFPYCPCSPRQLIVQNTLRMKSTVVTKVISLTLHPSEVHDTPVRYLQIISEHFTGTSIAN